MSNTKKPISVIDDVPPSTTEEYTHVFQQAGTVEHIRFRNYVGHEFDLRYRAYLDKKDGQRIDLIRSLGQAFVSGNNDVYELDVREAFDKDDELVVTAENADAERTYHASAVVEVDYAGGGTSWLAEVLP